MDAAAAGALIGFSIILAGCIGIRIYDIYTKRKKNQNDYISISTNTQSTPLLIRRPTHWKMKDLINTQYKNKSLQSMKGSRFLLTSSIDSQQRI